MLTIGSLFSGIGGLELGLEWAGHGPVLWQVERDEWCRLILRKHWPRAERFVDVRHVGAGALAPVDLICGGFPCQDVSSAGARKGLAGERSGLWSEFARVVAAIRPTWVVVENVASGAKLWVDAVVRELGGLGYDALPVPVSAADVGAPHLRRRIFIVAHAQRVPLREQPRRGGGADRQGPSEPGHRGDEGAAPNSEGQRCGSSRLPQRTAAAEPVPGIDGADDANPMRPGLQGAESASGSIARQGAAECAWAEDAMPQPALCRVDDGPAAWLDRGARLRAIGNAVVPQCAQVVGELISLLKETA